MSTCLSLQGRVRFSTSAVEPEGDVGDASAATRLIGDQEASRPVTPAVLRVGSTWETPGTTVKPPPQAVLAEFGAGSASPQLLPGGQGTTWRAGGVIVKPSTDADGDAWTAEVISGLTPRGYRVARPVRARNGAWIADGWCAWEVVAGSHGSGGRWSQIFPATRALHADLVELARPDFLASRTDAWAHGDRAAWADVAVDACHAAIGDLIRRCAALRVEEGLTCQIVHGDIYGNVLFDEGSLPAVIDLSPYWRPVEYALAVAAVDALAWFSAPATILDDLAELPALQSLLARAAMFRLVTADRIASRHRLDQDPGYVGGIVAEFSPVVDLIASTLAA